MIIFSTLLVTIKIIFSIIIEILNPARDSTTRPSGCHCCEGCSDEEEEGAKDGRTDTDIEEDKGLVNGTADGTDGQEDGHARGENLPDGTGHRPRMEDMPVLEDSDDEDEGLQGLAWNLVNARDNRELWTGVEADTTTTPTATKHRCCNLPFGSQVKFGGHIAFL